MKIATILLLSLSAANAAPQNLLSDIASALGYTQKKESTTTSAGKTLVPAATAASTSTAAAARTSASQGDSQTSTQVSTQASAISTGQSGRVILASSTISGTQSTITSSSSSDSNSTVSTSSSSSSSSTSSPSSSSTSTDLPSSTQASTQATQTASSSTNANSVPPAGVAVAVIMTLAIVAAFAWLLFRHHPRIRRWWEDREERRRQARSYRDAIDGPFAGRGGRGNGSGSGTVGARKSMLASFFAPRTVVLGNGQEIRRKPVNWGATDDVVPPVPAMPMTMEKVALTEMAAPMARNDSMKSTTSYHFAGNGSPSIGLGVTGLGGSNRSSPALAQKALPPMPPMPQMPVVAELGGSEVVKTDRDRDKDKDKKGNNMHHVLTRKSVFELA